MVIVGAGLAGLSTAIHLAAAGRHVTVFERDATAGGRAGQWESDGYRFDTGPTVVTMPDLLESVFAVVGEKMSDYLTLEQLDPAYRSYFPDGSTIDIRSTPAATAEEIATTISPAEAVRFEAFAQFARKLYDYEYNRFINSNVDSPFELVTADLARLVAMGGLRRMSTKIDQFFTDPRTRRMFSFQAMYAGLSPQRALALYCVIAYMDCIAGVYRPVGGVSQLPAALARAAADHGVEFHYNRPVERIVTAGSRATGVITSDGEFVSADVVVANPDLPIAYRDLLGWQPWNVRRLRYSPSCAVLLLGSAEQYRRVAHHNIHFGRAWKQTFDEIISAGTVMSDPSFFVTNATASDPTVAPAGRQTYFVLFPTPNAQAAIDWDRQRGPYRDHMLETMEKSGYRGITDGIEVEHLTTPADWQRMGMEAGTPFAARHSFDQTGPFRPRNIWGDNVVFAGSGTTPGVGIPMVIISGRLAAARITG